MNGKVPLDEGGDPPCWAHLLADDESPITCGTAAAFDAPADSDEVELSIDTGHVDVVGDPETGCPGPE